VDINYSRCQSLFGKDFEKLSNAKVLILGVGGVGSYTLDCLYKSGVTNITIIDYDTYESSNTNRQIGSIGNIGKCKVTILASLYPGITPIKQKMDLKWVESFDFEPYDIVIDAADTTKVKIEIAKKCYKKLIMSLGSANKDDFSQIEVSTIFKTHGDALARKIRYELKKANFNKNFTVVFSPQEPLNKNGGTFVAITGAFGLALCSEAIKKLINQ